MSSYPPRSQIWTISKLETSCNFVTKIFPAFRTYVSTIHRWVYLARIKRDSFTWSLFDSAFEDECSFFKSKMWVWSECGNFKMRNFQDGFKIRFSSSGNLRHEFQIWWRHQNLLDIGKTLPFNERQAVSVSLFFEFPVGRSIPGDRIQQRPTLMFSHHRSKFASQVAFVAVEDFFDSHKVNSERNQSKMPDRHHCNSPKSY